MEIRCINMTHEDWITFACTQIQDLSPEAISEVLLVIESDLNINLKVESND